MEEQNISYETAKLLKEKGVDTKAQAFYTLSYEDADITESYYSEEFLDKMKTSMKSGELKTHPSAKFGFFNTATSIIAPTQSQLQQWLRDKHGLHIEVLWDVDGKLYWFASITTIGDTVSDDRFTNTDRVDTFEEALELGLVKALELIE